MNVYLIAILVLLFLIVVILALILRRLKKYVRADWSLVFPELAGLYHGEESTHAKKRETVSRKNEKKVVKGPSAPGRNLEKFVDELPRLQTGDSVLCTAYSPDTVEAEEEFIIAAFISWPKQRKEVEREAASLDDELVKRAEKFLNLQVLYGDKISFLLRVDGCEVEDSAQELVWRGELGSVEFGVKVMPGFRGSKLIANLNIAIKGIPAGNIKFRIKVQKDSAVFETYDAPKKANLYKTAFISYASADRDEVLRRTQMLSAVGISFFQDIMNLRPGELWEKSLYREIDRCDVFFLFWSSAAKDSKWVRQEYEYAQKLQSDGNSLEIIPVPIEGPPSPDPPPQLSHLHFNDGFLYFITH